METATILVSKKFKEGESDVAGVNNSFRVINDVMQKGWYKMQLMKRTRIVDRNQNWVVGERIIGLKNERVDFYQSTNHIKIL